MSEFKLIHCEDEESLLQMHEIREKVLFTTGKYDRHHADDKNPNNYCFIFMVNNKSVGTVRLDFIECDKAAVRLVAVLPEYRGQKIGSAMLYAIEDYAKQKGVITLVTNSAVNAKGFYEAIGYVSENWIDPGEGTSELTIPMTKKLIPLSKTE